MFSLKALLAKLSTGQRMAISLGALLALTVIISIVGYTALSRITADGQHALKVNARVTEQSLKVSSGVSDLRRYEKDVFLNLRDAGKVADYEKKWQGIRDGVVVSLGVLYGLV